MEGPGQLSSRVTPAPAGPTVFERVVHTTWVVVHSTEPPSDAECEHAWANLSANYATVKGTLIVTLGGGPNARQRQRMREVLGARKMPRTAVLTKSTVGRLIVTAFNLFSDQNLRLFAPDDIDAALRYLDVHALMVGHVRQQVDAFRRVLSIREP